MNLKHLLVSASLPASLLICAGTSVAQVTITADQTDPIVTSVAGDGGTPSDVTIDGGIAVTPANGTAVTIDSDNSVTNEGSITIEDADDAIGVDLQGGSTGDLTFVAGSSMQIIENFTPEDTDDDNIPDGGFAQGSGRTGILVSGASPFTGNVTIESGANITVEGNDSYGIRVLQAAGLAGNLSALGGLSVTGQNSRGISIEGNLDGNLTTATSVSTTGLNATAIAIEGNVSGQFNNQGTVANTGYRFTQRQGLANRELLDEGDFFQAGSAILINGNIGNGIFLERVITDVENADGTTTSRVTGLSNVTQRGSAPAIIIDGRGNPIAIGIVASIIDPADEDFDAAEQYAFYNQGTILAEGIDDDINATALEIRDAVLANGINNVASMTSNTFRSGDNGEADIAGETGLARVIVFGDGAIVEEINNSGVIAASVSEATDEVYADRDNVVAARHLQAVAIDIEAGGDVTRIINSSTISSAISGRNGQSVAIRDASGTLRVIENTGVIAAVAINSDSIGLQETSFERIALDLAANTTGVTITQSLAVDEDTTDDITPNPPSINGNILLGSGNDVVTASAGAIVGDLAFGDGMDTLTLSGETSYSGTITDSDGLLTIDVSDGSTLTQSGAAALNVTSASFDGTSTFRPTLDGETGDATALVATGDISLADGATIAPILNNVISSVNTTYTVLNAGGTLSLGGDVASLSSDNLPFMYNTGFSRDPNNPNALIITLDLRSTEELGLDAVQTASFASAFDAMQNNVELANAFTNITDGAEFNSALNQLLPEFAAASRQFVHANIDGAVGAVGSHLDTLRKSQDKPGGIWIQEFAYFADRELAGLSEQYRGHGFGITGGIDTELGLLHAFGLNFGFATTEIEDVAGFDSPLDVITLQLGAYGGYSSGNLGIEAYAGVGFNDFEADRNINVGSYTASANGDWSGLHYNASLRAGYDIAMGEKFWLRPAVSLDYMRLRENAYEETGDLGVALSVDERTSEMGGVTAMLNFGTEFKSPRSWIRPSLRIGYRNEFINDGIVTNYRFVGLTPDAMLTSAEFPESGILVGFSLAAGSAYSSFGFDFDSDIRDGFIRHTGRIVLRLIF